MFREKRFYPLPVRQAGVSWRNAPAMQSQTSAGSLTPDLLRTARSLCY